MDETIRRLERVAALGWQAADRAWLGGWQLRAAHGYTGRANSVLPLGPPGRPIPEAVEAVRRWYGARSVRACFAIPHPMPGPPADDPLDRFLAARGWPLRSGPGVVMTAPAARLARLGAGVAVEVAEQPDKAWLALYHYRGQAAPAVAAELLLSAPWQAFAAVRADGGTVAIGRVAVAAGWAGVSAIEVEAGHRRRGLATAVIGALARVAVGKGVRRVYLQVDEENHAAHALYAGCGFVERHRYHYRLCPADAG